MTDYTPTPRSRTRAFVFATSTILCTIFILQLILLPLLTPLVAATPNKQGAIVITNINSQNFSGLPNKDFDLRFTVLNNGTQQRSLRVTDSGFGSLDIQISPEDLSLGP